MSTTAGTNSFLRKLEAVGFDLCWGSPNLQRRPKTRQDIYCIHGVQISCWDGVFVVWCVCKLGASGGACFCGAFAGLVNLFNYIVVYWREFPSNEISTGKLSHGLRSHPTWIVTLAEAQAVTRKFALADGLALWKSSSDQRMALPMCSGQVIRIPCGSLMEIENYQYL